MTDTPNQTADDCTDFWNAITAMALREEQERRLREHEEWLTRMKEMGLL